MADSQLNVPFSSDMMQFVPLHVRNLLQGRRDVSTRRQHSTSVNDVTNILDRISEDQETRTESSGLSWDSLMSDVQVDISPKPLVASSPAAPDKNTDLLSYERKRCHEKHRESVEMSAESTSDERDTSGAKSSVRGLKSDAHTDTFMLKIMPVYGRLFAQLEKLFWWELMIRMNFLSGKLDTPNINSALRALRVASWIPRKKLFMGRVLGRGAFGKAFLVHTEKRKEYVVKIMSMKLQFDRLQAIRVERDSLVISDHPNIIKIKGSWIVRKPYSVPKIYFLMEYANYGSLTTFMRKTRPEAREIRALINSDARYQVDPYSSLDEITIAKMENGLTIMRSCIEQREKQSTYEKIAFRALVLRLSRELVDAVDYIHNHGITHCDLSTENILLGKGFHIKVADFGISNINHPIYSDEYYRLHMDINLSQSISFDPRALIFPDPFFANIDLQQVIKLLIAISTGLNLSFGETILLSVKEAMQLKMLIPHRFARYLFFDEILLDVFMTIEQLFKKINDYTNDSKIMVNSALFDLTRYSQIRTLDVQPYIKKLYELEAVSNRDGPDEKDIFSAEEWDSTPEVDAINAFLDDSVLKTPM